MISVKDMLTQLEPIRAELQDRKIYAPNDKSIQLALGQLKAAMTSIAKIKEELRKTAPWANLGA